MSTSNPDGKRILKYISYFLTDIAPALKTGSKNTLKNYRTALDLYLLWLEDVKHIDEKTLNASCFEAKMIDKWLIWLKTERKNTNDSCNVRLGSIRTFIKYLSKQAPEYRYLKADAEDVDSLKRINRKVHGISRDAVKVLLSMPSESTRSGRMYLTLFTIMYSLALRIGEVLSIKIKDIQQGPTQIKVTIHGKGSKIRTLAISGNAQKLMEAYISQFHGSKTSDIEAYLFFSNTKGKHEQLTQSAVRKMLCKYAGKAHERCKEIPAELTPHQLRHAKATHLYEDGIGIVKLSEILGHSTIETTMIYLDLTDDQKAEALATMENESDKNTIKKWKTKNPASMRDAAGTRSSSFMLPATV